MGAGRSWRCGRDESGAVAIMVAISMLMLVVAAALVTDFGVVRLDRQQNKLAADDAVMAGLRAAGNDDDGQMYNEIGVCAAVDFLRANRPALSGLTGCVPDTTHMCAPGDPSFTFHQTVTSGSNSYEVWVKSPYSLTDTSMGGAWQEDALGSLSTDVGDPARGGCDQLAVAIRESTTPVLGRIVTQGQPLKTRIRSVGRVTIKTDAAPPALLLLERSSCSVLTVGSAGSPSRIAVKGSGETPATIHSDSNATGSDCGSGPNQQVYQGKQANGVIAYGGSTGRPGTITSVATEEGKPANVVSDSIANIFGTTGVYPTATDQLAVTPRKPVTRRPVDKHYLPGVTNTAVSAYSRWLLNHSTPGLPWTRYGCPTAANMTAMSSMTAADAVYIDCPGSSGITLNGRIGAGTIYFHGFIKSGKLAMPNATTVYVDDTDNAGARINSSAITLGNNNSFCVRAGGLSGPNCDPNDPDVSGTCSETPSGVPSAKAQLVIRRGQLDSSSGALLRLCSTTVILEGGQLGSGSTAAPGGCLPLTLGTAPTATPCPGASTDAGTSPVSLSGKTDWTAPNSIGDMAALTPAAKQALWDGGEDLALWTETYGDGPTYKMAGGGNMHVAGVFFVPNAYPFTITGSGAQDLTNAQYVTRTFAVDGGATLTMGVDPNNAVSPPTLDPFTLVR